LALVVEAVKRKDNAETQRTPRFAETKAT
jgi:hypothetical protein